MKEKATPPAPLKSNRLVGPVERLRGKETDAKRGRKGKTPHFESSRRESGPSEIENVSGKEEKTVP